MQLCQVPARQAETVRRWTRRVRDGRGRGRVRRARRVRRGVGLGRGKGTLVIYSAQHPETTAALVAAFTKQTGIKVRLKNDDEDVLTAQIEQEGSRSPADVFFTENSNWLQQLDDKGLLAKRRLVHPGPRAEPRQRRQRQVARGLGPLQRPDLQPQQDRGVAAAHLRDGLADPQYKGKLELAPAETDFWPIVRSICARTGARRRSTG